MNRRFITAYFSIITMVFLGGLVFLDGFVVDRIGVADFYGLKWLGCA